MYIYIYGLRVNPYPALICIYTYIHMHMHIYIYIYIYVNIFSSLCSAWARSGRARFTDSSYTKGTRAEKHRELIREWLWEPKVGSFEYIWVLGGGSRRRDPMAALRSGPPPPVCRWSRRNKETQS